MASEAAKGATAKGDIQKAFLLARNDLKIKFEKEHQFENSKGRRFRFDWAIPSLKIAVEYEGIFSNKSGHTTAGGYTKDCTKYNLATMEGWCILRYTAINCTDIFEDLELLIKKRLQVD